MSDTIDNQIQTTNSAPNSSVPPVRPEPQAPSSRNPNLARATLLSNKWTIRILILGGVALAIYFGYQSLLPSTESEEVTLTHTVSRMNLLDTVVERGMLESQSTVNGVCRLHGYSNKITYLAEEGAHVEKDEVVVRFDSSSIKKDLIEERILLTKAQAKVDEAVEQIEVQKNQNESDIASAELEKTLAELDLEKYRDGDYTAELADMERSIAESKAALSQKQDRLKNMRVLVKKGFREPEQVRQLEQEVVSARFQVERDEQKKDVLEKFEKKRKLTELRSKAEETVRKLARAKTTAKANLAKARLKLEAAREELVYQQQEVEEEEEQLKHCEIVASQAGTVAYANNRWMDQQFRVRPGGNIHRRQTVFHLPDMTRMQVKLEFHESIINKLAIGKSATIRVDAFSDFALRGEISKIADLARSDTDANTQNYTGIVKIEHFPSELKLKPGMTAETEILIRELKDVLAVPVQAVTEHLDNDYVYVKTKQGFERRKIQVESGNESYLVVTSGLEVGEEVAMDAYQRGLDDFGTNNHDGPSESDFPSEESSTEKSSQPADTPEKKAPPATQPNNVGKTSSELESKDAKANPEPATSSSPSDSTPQAKEDGDRSPSSSGQ